MRKIFCHLRFEPADSDARDHAANEHRPRITVLSPSNKPRPGNWLDTQHVIQIEWDGVWQIPLYEQVAKMLDFFPQPPHETQDQITDAD